MFIRRMFIGLLALLCICSLSYAQNEQEEITLITYYPAPYGDYEDLSVYNIIGEYTEKPYDLRILAGTQIIKDAHAPSSDNYHLELYSTDMGEALNEVSLRFHQSKQYRGQIRYNGQGFRFTKGEGSTYLGPAPVDIGKSSVTKDAHGRNANSYHLRLYSDDLDDPEKEVSLRFHQEGQYWYQIRARGNAQTVERGLFFTQGENIGHEPVALTNIHAANITYSSTGSSSDIRYKKNIRNLENVLPGLLTLRGITYEWDKEGHQEKGFEGGVKIGLIAQNVEGVFPELVKTDGRGYKSLEYEKMVAVLIEAIKEQQAEIEVLRSVQNDSKKEIVVLKSKLVTNEKVAQDGI